MVSRNVAVALVAVCVILIVSLAGVMAYYMRVIDDKNAQYDSYVASHSRTNAEYDSYVASHSHNDSDYNASVSLKSSLQSQVDTLQAPDVLEVNLKEDNIYLPSQTSYLHIYGYLFNAGTLTATDVRLHVMLYSLENTPIEAYVDVRSMGGRTWTPVDTNITYDTGSGFLLTGWTVALMVNNTTVTN